MPEPHEDLAEDERVLWRWRYQAALDAGLSRVNARMLADMGIEANDIRVLCERGCPPDLIVELLV